jgi:hypothetical protein
MKKYLFLFLFLQMNILAFSQPTKSFFVVHADPIEPNGVNFSDLVSLIDTANSFGVKLTIEFSKPWCDTIISSSSYMAMVRQWQIAGHEIGVHHHDYVHPAWDGYSNTPMHPPHPQGVPFIGNMTTVYNATDSVCGDSLCLTVGTGPDSLESVTDYNGGWIYQTNGSLDDTSAFSNVSQYQFGPYAVCELSYTFLETGLDNIGIQNLFNASSKTTCGVVAHVWNWAANKPLYVDWLTYISAKTPGQCKSVRQIIRESSCTVSTSIDHSTSFSSPIIIYPNPTNGNIRLQFGETAVNNIEIFTVNGQLIYHSDLSNNSSYFDLDFSIYSVGVYIITLRTNDSILTRKIIKQ